MPHVPEPITARWVHITEETAMLDLARMVREYLSNGGGLSLDHDPAEIGATILRQLVRQRERPLGSSSLRLSSSGSCLKRLMFDWHGTPANGFQSDSSAILAFGTGDATEALLVAALREVFARLQVTLKENPATAALHVELTNTGAGQDQVRLQVPFAGGLDKALIAPYPGLSIPGHPDGRGFVPFWAKGSDPVSIPFVLEVKSMSDFGFKKFRDRGFTARDDKGPDGYYYQSQAYQLALRQAGIDVEWTYVIAFGKSVGAKDAEVDRNFVPPNATRGKNAGKPKKSFMVSDPTMWSKTHSVVGQWMRRDEVVQADIIQRYQQVMSSRSPADIAPPYEPDDNGRLKFPCDWCPHLLNCYPSATEVCSKGGWFQPNVKIHTYT